jgi:4'-phosphopantetheinyl transferase EntD
VSAATTDPILQQALERIAPAGVLVGHRLIALGDENALTPDEAASIASAVPQARRASGAARIVARQLMQRLGYGAPSIPREPSGMPLWPAGLRGSLAHDESVAVAAVTRADVVQTLGVDIEPALPLPADMRDLVLTRREREALPDDPLAPRVVFAAKEAVYKAAYPIDHTFLEFADIEVDLVKGRATTRTGRTFSLRYCTAPRIVVLAIAAA